MSSRQRKPRVSAGLYLGCLIALALELVLALVLLALGVTLLR